MTPTPAPPLSCGRAARPATGCGLSSRRSPAWVQPDRTEVRHHLAGGGPGLPGASRSRPAADRSAPPSWPAAPGGRTAEQIFGAVDAQKLCSSVTLFMHADPGEPVFRQVLDQYFGGVPDSATQERI